ncbi:MAG: DUF4432 family protein, partial [Kiritimatiellae bacterium]|nr:DUF4432 family protein [Kiritimatiellia bacterium]
MKRKRKRRTLSGDHGARVVIRDLRGWQALTLENEQLAVTVLPEYGGWLWSVMYKPRKIELLWQCPRGVPARNDPPVVPDPLYAYRARTLGAWPEIFPHGSGPVEVAGTKLPMHGEVTLRAWETEVQRAKGRDAVVRMWVECHLLPLRLDRTLSVASDGAVLRLQEEVTNYSALPVDFMWGHHPLFGKPLLSGQSRIVAPAGCWLDDAEFKPHPWPGAGDADKSVCPPEGAERGEMFYLDKLTSGWCALVNPAEKLAVALTWDTNVFQYVWVWREANSSKGYPYFGRAYAVAIEPFSS